MDEDAVPSIHPSNLIIVHGPPCIPSEKVKKTVKGNPFE